MIWGLILIYLAVGCVLALRAMTTVMCKLGIHLTAYHRWGLIIGSLFKVPTWPLSMMVDFAFPHIKDRLLRAYHPALQPRPAVNPMGDLVFAPPSMTPYLNMDSGETRELGYVAVDSGTIYLSDPCWSKIPAKLGAEGIESLKHQTGRLLVEGFGGDGLYPVIGYFDSRGLLNSVTIDFVNQAKGEWPER